jgi:hypothetical protein
MTKVCSQTNIPSVNEDAPTCPTPIKEECIFMTEARTNPITINVDEDYKTVLNRLLAYIITLENRIIILETP